MLIIEHDVRADGVIELGVSPSVEEGGPRS
jgi:hypothetical protein